MIRSAHTRKLLVAGLYCLPLVIAAIVRAQLPSFFEYESQEDTVRALAILEKGDIPLYGIGHIRFLGAALGPLVYYIKMIPYLFSASPWSEIVFLFILHLAAVLASMLLARKLLSDLFAPAIPAWLAHAGALAVGVLLALSVHSNTLTSHPHPSYYAASFTIVFVAALYDFAVRGRTAAAPVAGAMLGIMTQLYQLTLFAPFLLVLVLLAARRMPTRRDALMFFLPLLLCYVPYLASELFTGFWNTRSLFTLAPGPRDETALGARSLVGNLAFVADAAVAHFHVTDRLDGLWLLLAAAGLAVSAWASLRNPAARFLICFFLFYTVLPAVALGVPRFQLMLPASQLAVAVGAVALVLAASRIASRPLAALLLAVPFVFSLAFSGSNAAASLRGHVFYPLNMLLMEPAGRTPDLGTSSRLARTLHEQFGLTLHQFPGRVFSPVAASGLYGHQYLLRIAQADPPQAGSGQSTTAPLPSRSDRSPTDDDPTSVLFVTDDLFPHEVSRLAGHSRTVDRSTVSPIAQRMDPDSFTLRVSCDQPWCASRSGPRHAGLPVVRFFWGCGEFRDLDESVNIPAEQCEDLLQAPRHSRTYEGRFTIPPHDPDCRDCRQMLYLAVSNTCKVTAHVDGLQLDWSWAHAHEQDIGLAQLPAPVSGSGEHRLALEIADCVPFRLETLQFTGRPRP